MSADGENSRNQRKIAGFSFKENKGQLKPESSVHVLSELLNTY